MATRFCDCFADEVARLCLDKFAELPKSGKPQKSEWTILSGVVKCVVTQNTETGGELACKTGKLGARCMEQRCQAGKLDDQFIKQVHQTVKRDDQSMEQEREGGEVLIQAIQSVKPGTPSLKQDGVPGQQSDKVQLENNAQISSEANAQELPPQKCAKSTEPVTGSHECDIGDIEMEVVALGTGSKCLGTAKWCPKGTLVHDSHAEVVAKRSLQLYLMDQAHDAYLGKESVFYLDRDNSSVDDHKGSCSSVESNDGQSNSCCEWKTDGDEDCDLEKPQNSFDAGKSNGNLLCAKKSDIERNPKIENTCCHSSATLQVHEHENAVKSCSLVEVNDSPKLVLKTGISFHLFVSHTPCGDCSIFPRGEHTAIGDCVTANDNINDHAEPIVSPTGNDKLSSQNDNKFLPYQCSSDETAEPLLKKFKQDKCQETSQCESSTFETLIKKAVPELALNCSLNAKTDVDIHRTGAKCAAGETVDFHLPGSSYHVVGPLRTKPGRGAPTLSHCCSDKLLKWSVMGVQGCLLMPFLRFPVYLETLVIGSSPYSEMAMERGLFLRYEKSLKKMELKSGFRVARLRILKSDARFAHSRDGTKNRINSENVLPCPSSVSWHPGYGERKSQVFVDGRKLGITKKSLGTVKSHVPICRYQIMRRIISLHAVRDEVSYTRLNDKNVQDHSCENSGLNKNVITSLKVSSSEQADMKESGSCVKEYMERPGVKKEVASLRESRERSELYGPSSTESSCENISIKKCGTSEDVPCQHPVEEKATLKKSLEDLHRRVVENNDDRRTLIEKKSYKDLKNLSDSYTYTWKYVKEKVLVNWTTKPAGLQDFFL